MTTRTTCRVCEGALESVLSLGEQYVSGFVSPLQPDGPKAPLELVLCQQCRLLQLRHTVPGDMMYQNYWYRSGTNQTMRDRPSGHFQHSCATCPPRRGRFCPGHRLQ